MAFSSPLEPGPLASAECLTALRSSALPIPTLEAVSVCLPPPCGRAWQCVEVRSTIKNLTIILNFPTEINCAEYASHMHIQNLSRIYGV